MCGSPPLVLHQRWCWRGLAEPSGELIQTGLLTCVFRYETDEPKCTADAGLAGLNALREHRPAGPPACFVSVFGFLFFSSPLLLFLLHGWSNRGMIFHGCHEYRAQCDAAA